MKADFNTISTVVLVGKRGYSQLCSDGGVCMRDHNGGIQVGASEIAKGRVRVMKHTSEKDFDGMAEVRESKF